jgi:lipopolysaccharide biosynthesis glycosyltransferase
MVQQQQQYHNNNPSLIQLQQQQQEHHPSRGTSDTAASFASLETTTTTTTTKKSIQWLTKSQTTTENHPEANPTKQQSASDTARREKTTVAAVTEKRNKNKQQEIATTRTTTNLVSSNHHNTTTTTRQARFAYAYVVGGCDPQNPVFRKFLYQILINTYLQRKEGSTADVIVFVQISYRSSARSLPAADSRFLKAMNIQIQYLPKSKTESFDQLQMEKFRVLDLTRYDRVLFLDGDVMTLGSYDYLFELSMQGILKRNVVFAGRTVPASGHMFLVQPRRKSYSRILELIRDKEQRGKALPFPHWDVDRGWGHPFDTNEPKDHYELIGGTRGSSWDFNSAFSDQGLLYHWVKYEEQDVSIIFKNAIKNYGKDHIGQLHLEERLDLHIFDKHAVKHRCYKNYMDRNPCSPPHDGIIHFTGGKKPWLSKPPETPGVGSAESFWWQTLATLNEQLNLGIDFEKWKPEERPLLGMYANNIDVVESPVETRPQNANKKPAQFAFAYVVGGCDPDKPAFRHFISNILINTYLMREEGSEADVVIFVQMSFSSEYEQLPKKDLQVLEDMSIKVYYIPKSEDEGIDRLMFDKFRVLRLTQYKRVMYLDADVMVRGSLDYMFQLSMDGSIKENLVLNGRKEPAVGTIFMVAPQPGDWDNVLDVIREKEEQGEWNETAGWGHVFERNEKYEILNGLKRNGWGFTGAMSDQGLLFQWVKYVKKSFTVILRNGAQNWGADKKGNIKLEKSLDLDVFASKAKSRECWEGTLNQRLCTPPISDIVHFSGQQKPWLRKPPEDLSEATASTSPAHFWYYTLSILNDKLDLGWDFDYWKEHEKPLLGVFVSQEMSGTSYANTADKIASPYTKTFDRTVARRFAYAYVVGGCKPEDPSYRNYLNDIMISTYVQREEGSQADVIVFVQMAYGSKYDRLPQVDMKLLTAMDIIVKYIPKTEDESFYRIMLDKFRILDLTEYERVLFMDSDVMTRSSLDYLMELSVQGILKKTIVFAGVTEPANGGTFMLTPHEHASDKILQIIQGKEERGAKLPYPHWDTTVGWNHTIDDGDYWQDLREKKNTTWGFYGAFADQGLLFHWVKYEEKSVSIFFRKTIQNWDVGPDGNVRLEKTMKIDDLMNNVHGSRKCWSNVMKYKPCVPPHSDFVHFTSRSKPWLRGPPPDLGQVDGEESAFHYWFHILSILNEKMQIGLDFSKWRVKHHPFLGMYPKQKDVVKTKYASTKARHE